MKRHVGSRSLLLLAALAALLVAVQPSLVNAQAKDVHAQNVPPLRHNPLPKPQQAMSAKPAEVMNAWTVGLAGGLLEGAPIRLAAEMARVVDDGDNLHVLPVVTRGPTENVNSLLYLHGIDLAIINSDSLDEYKRQIPDIQRKITYVLNLFPSELHILVRPEIQSLSDLAGKKVNFNTQGTAAAYSGPLIFSRLGLDVEKTFVPHQVALEQMRKGEGGMAAVVFVTSKPVDAFVRGRFEPGFKFLPVPYDRRLEDYYLPATLDAADYPNLIKQGERVDTIAVPTALVAFNWQATSNRHDRVARFVNICSRGSTSCRGQPSIPNGERSTLPRRFQAWRASQRHRPGSMNTRMEARHRNDRRAPPVAGCYRGRGWGCVSARCERSDGAASCVLSDGKCGPVRMLRQAIACRSASTPAGARGRWLGHQRDHVARGLFPDCHRHNLIAQHAGR